MKGDMNWWTRLQWAWSVGVTVWRDPEWIDRTITLDQVAYARVVWGSDGVLVRGWSSYAGPDDVARFGLVTEHLDPRQVRVARGMHV